MQRKDDIEELIRTHCLRLQKLKQQQAEQGRSTPPEILTEIEDIKATIKDLETELKDMEVAEESSPPLFVPAFPPPPRWFTNREDELEQLRDFFNTHTTLIIAGIPGIGKTSLGRKFGYDNLSDLPKIWIDCEEDMSVELFMMRIADAMEADTAEQVRKFASSHQTTNQKAFGIAVILDTRDYVLFLDSYENVISTSVHKFIKELYQVLRNARIIIISRAVPLDLPAAAIIKGGNLTGLLEDNSVELLQNLGVGNIDRGSLVGVHKKLQGHPKLLEIFSHWTRRLEMVNTPDRLPETLAEVQQYLITEVLKKDLSSSKQELLRVICTYRLPVSIEAIKALYQNTDLPQTLGSLADRLLVARGADRKYSVHALVREFCASELGISPQRHLRAAEYYLAQSSNISQANLDDLIEAYYHGLQANDRDLAYKIFLVLVEQLDTKGFFELLITTCEGLLKLDSISPGQRAEALTYLGFVYRRRGELERAIQLHEEALTIYREIKDMKGEQDNLEHLAAVHRESGRIKKAIELLLRALLIARAIGDPDGVLSVLCNVGIVNRQIGQFKEAASYHEEGRALATRSRKIMGRNLQNLGTAYYYLGKISEAEQVLQQSIDESESAKDRREASYSLQCLGLVRWYEDDLDGAEELCRQAIKTCQDIGYLRGEANTLGNLGLIYLKREQLYEAQSYFEQARSLCVKVDNPHGENRHLSNLAQVFRNQGLNEKAWDCLQEALGVACKIGDRWGEAHCLWHLGTLLQELGQQEQAFKSLSLYNNLREVMSSPILPSPDLEISQLSQQLEAQMSQEIQEQAGHTARRETTEHLKFLNL
ncbi:tetratricopeptide repeat protein [Chloroflexota bacterium]